MVCLRRKAGGAAGADAVFVETPPIPQEAMDDGPNLVQLDQTATLVQHLSAIRDVTLNLSCQN